MLCSLLKTFQVFFLSNYLFSSSAKIYSDRNRTPVAISYTLSHKGLHLDNSITIINNHNYRKCFMDHIHTNMDKYLYLSPELDAKLDRFDTHPLPSHTVPPRDYHRTRFLPSSRPHTTTKPSSRHHTTVKPSSRPHTTVKPSSRPHTTTKPSSRHHTTVKPSSRHHTTVKPSSRHHTTVKPSSHPHTTVKPSSRPHTTVKPSSRPHTTVKPSSQHVISSTSPYYSEHNEDRSNIQNNASPTKSFPFKKDNIHHDMLEPTYTVSSNTRVNLTHIIKSTIRPKPTDGSNYLKQKDHLNETIATPTDPSHLHESPRSNNESLNQSLNKSTDISKLHPDTTVTPTKVLHVTIIGSNQPPSISQKNISRLPPLVEKTRSTNNIPRSSTRPIILLPPYYTEQRSVLPSTVLPSHSSPISSHHSLRRVTDTHTHKPYHHSRHHSDSEQSDDDDDDDDHRHKDEYETDSDK